MPFERLSLNYTADKLKPLGSRSWVQVRKADRFYSSQLRRVARVIGEIVQTLMPDESEVNPDDALAQQAARKRMEDRSRTLTEALQHYSRQIQPWARTTAERMMLEVAHRDKKAWMEHSDLMGRALRREIETEPTGYAFRELLDYEVGLITSLPTDAAKRVHDLTVEGLIKGTRAKDISDAIMRTGHVTKARADLIARTEVSRTGTTMTRARAESIGIQEFEWVTAHDAQVRPSHAALNGRVFRWDQPPVCDPPNHRALPGCIWNCRCIAAPRLSANIFDSYRGRR